MTKHKHRARVGLALLMAAALVACGDDGSDDGVGVASLGEAEEIEEEGDGAGEGEEATAADRDDALLEFAECMRENGVAMPDPDVSGGGRGRIEISSDMGSPEEIEAAQNACQHIMDDAAPGDARQMDPEEQAEMQDRMLAFAACMREHGIDMPDPEFDGGRVRSRVGDGGLDPESDEFREAEDTCREEAGFEEGEGPGGARPSDVKEAT